MVGAGERKEDVVKGGTVSQSSLDGNPASNEQIKGRVEVTGRSVRGDLQRIGTSDHNMFSTQLFSGVIAGDYVREIEPESLDAEASLQLIGAALRDDATPIEQGDPRRPADLLPRGTASLTAWSPRRPRVAGRRPTVPRGDAGRVPCLGSSRKRRSGRSIMLIARSNRRFMSPNMSRARRCPSLGEIEHGQQLRGSVAPPSLEYDASGPSFRGSPDPSGGHQSSANWPVRLIDFFTPIGAAIRSWPAPVARPGRAAQGRPISASSSLCLFRGPNRANTVSPGQKIDLVKNELVAIGLRDPRSINCVFHTRNCI